MLTEKALTPLPPLPKVGRLDSFTSVRRELRRLYVDARQGRIETSDASRLAFILSTIVKVLEHSDTDERLSAIESTLTQLTDDEPNRAPTAH